MKKKILIIRFNPLRDFIHCVPAFNAIRKFHQNDEITILTEKELIKFCKKSGLFDKVWLDVKPEWFQFAGLKDLRSRIIAGKFDMVYDLQNDKRSAWYFKFIGYNKPMWSSSIVSWCSHYYDPGKKILHFQEILHNQLKVAGIKSTPLIDISSFANNDADELPEKFAMICAGGNRDKIAHKWDPVKYAEVIDHLHKKYNMPSVLVGDGGDDNLINSLIAARCLIAKPINFSGKTSINGIISVAKKARFCLGNETAPTHMAAYSGRRTIMFCSRFSPVDLIVPIVKNLAVIEEPMLENVDTDRVISAIEEFGFIEDKDNELKGFRVSGDNELQKP